VTRSLLCAALIAGLLAAAAGCGEPDDPVLAQYPGYTAYKKHCRKCHGNDGRGDRASRVAERPVDLGAPAFRDTTGLAGIEHIIRVGKGKMKGYSETLDAAQIAEIARVVWAMPTREAR
jgi:mono/diheme cytochrome c family protein